MSDLQLRLHREHVNRQRKFFPVERKPVMAPAVAPKLEVPGPQPKKPSNSIIFPMPEGSRSMQEIAGHVANRYGRTTEEFFGTRRVKYIAFPRQVAMFLCREIAERSYPEIGALFKKDHSTVIHAHRKISKLRDENKNFAATLEKIHKELTGE